MTYGNENYEKYIHQHVFQISVSTPTMQHPAQNLSKVFQWLMEDTINNKNPVTDLMDGAGLCDRKSA